MEQHLGDLKHPALGAPMSDLSYNLDTSPISTLIFTGEEVKLRNLA